MIILLLKFLLLLEIKLAEVVVFNIKKLQYKTKYNKIIKLRKIEKDNYLLIRK
jgi:hypothetical protein